MRKRAALPLRWARDGALLALALSALALLMPSEWGGYPGWDDAALVIHNLTAIAIRVAILALIGFMLGSFWSRARHRRQRHLAPPRKKPR
jgi:hypothetical protein